MKEVVDSLKKTLHERLASPFTGSFIVTWLIVNWRFILVILSGEKYSQKIIFIEAIYPLVWWKNLFFLVLLPAAGALFYISFYQIFLAKTLKVWIQGENAKAVAQEKRLFDEEERKELVAHVSELVRQNTDLDKENAQLNIKVKKFDKAILEKKNLQVKLDDITKKKDNAIIEIKKQKTENTKLKKERDIEKSENKKIKTLNDNIEKIIKEQSFKLSEMDNEIKARTVWHEKLESKNEKIKEENNSLKQNINIITEERDAEIKEKKKIHETILTLKKDLFVHTKEEEERLKKGWRNAVRERDQAIKEQDQAIKEQEKQKAVNSKLIKERDNMINMQKENEKQGMGNIKLIEERDSAVKALEHIKKEQDASQRLYVQTARERDQAIKENKQLIESKNLNVNTPASAFDLTGLVIKNKKNQVDDMQDDDIIDEIFEDR
jgi:hypothetical protein